MKNILRYILVVVTSMSSVCSFAQTKEKTFDELAEFIKQSTYFDSSSVFNEGRKAIELARELNDKSKEALIYQYFGNYHFYSGRMLEAGKYYDTSIVMAAKAKDSILVISNKIRKTFILAAEDSYAAEKQFSELLNLSQAPDNFKNRLEIYNGLGLIYEDRKDQAEALSYYLKALAEAEELDDLYFRGMLHNNIGLIKLRNEQFEAALEDFEKGLVFSDSVNEVRLSFNLYNNIGLLHYSKGENEKALFHYIETLQRAKDLGFPYAIAVAHLNISNSYNLVDLPKDAIAHADSAILFMEQSSELKNYPLALFLKATGFRKLKNYKLGLDFAKQGINASEQTKQLENISRGYELKSNLLEDLGRYKEALEAYQAYHNINDSLEQLSNRERYAELQVAYETEKKDADLKEERAKTDLLITKTDLLQKENKLKETRIIITIVISVLVVLLVFVFFYLRHLRLSRAQQRVFTQKLIENLDEERGRISRDLHDDIGQSLSVVKSKINMAGKGESINWNELESGIGDIIDQSRTISHRLHPSYLEKIGLNRSIESLLERVEKNTGLITSCELNSSVEEISTYRKTQLYRILQESINNTLKHAKAKSVKITIEKVGKEFKCIYRDNGVGFDWNTAKNGGIGMMTINERAKKMDAKLTIQTEPEKGFKFHLKF